MVKVLHYPARVVDGEEIQPDTVYRMKLTDSVLSLYFTAVNQGETVEKSLEFPLDVYRGKIVQVLVTCSVVKNDVKIVSVYEQVTRGSFLLDTATRDLSIARLAFSEDCSEIVVFLNRACRDVAGFENVVLDPGAGCLTGYLMEHSEFCARKIARLQVKARMINEVDHYASISYLEAQVDILTRLVRRLLIVSESVDDELKELLELADGYSVLDIKNRSAVRDEFANKAKIRRLQRVYYADKEIAK